MLHWNRREDDTSTMQLHYQRYGAGHPLIILHGLFGSLTNWNTLSKQWGARYEVIAVDQRNHGASPRTDAMTYDLMADDLRMLLQTLELPTAFVLGHSMGGKTAMQFALRYPECVDKLIVADMAPRAYPPHHDTIFRALRGLDLNRYTNRNDLDQALAAQLPERAERQFLLTNVVRGEQGFRWKIGLDAIYDQYANIVAAIGHHTPFNKPTLFLRGDRSDYITDADEADIRNLFPRARVEKVAGAGHWVHADAPDALSRLVLDFLAE